ncbi:MAG TPA: Ig-like domain-containing protein [Candidatus Binataceae bacterium]
MLGSFLQACGGGGGGAPVTNIKSITIDPVNSSIAVGTNVQLHATANFKNKTTKDVTDSVTWESADETVATVSNAAAQKGLADGKGVGATKVKAKLHGIAGISTFTVTNATLKSITDQPVNPLVAKGTTVQEVALGNFSDGSVQDLTTQVSFSSGNSSIAQVDNTSGTIGLVTGVSPGNTLITATLNGIEGSTTVTVTAATLTSITIAGAIDSIAKKTTLQLTATCNFSDGTTQDCTSQLSWTTGDSGIAQVSDTSPTKGSVTGAGAGNATITGSLGGIQGSAMVIVTAATLTSLTITPPDASLAKGTEMQLIATGNFSDGTTEDLTSQVSWTSDDNATAQVSDAPGTEGMVTGLGAGSSAITATLDGVQGSTTLTETAATLVSLTITPPDASIAKGTEMQLIATGNFSDGSTEDLTSQVSWTSGDNAIAQVSDAARTKGLATGLGAGSSAITATLDGVQGSTTVIVTAAIVTSITVDPDDPSIAKGTTVQLNATCDFTDGTTQNCTSQVSWTSGNNVIAQVSGAPGTEGLVTGIGVGSTAITVTLNGVQGSTTVTVTAPTLTSLTITPAVPSIAKGTTVQPTASGTFSDGTTEDLTSQVSWTSGNNAIAQVSDAAGTKGLATGLGVGSTAITATLSGIQGSTTVIVTAATLTSLIVTPANPSLEKGMLQMTATAVFSDGTTQNVTSQVDWISSNETVAHIISSSSPVTNGRLMPKKPGVTTITATLGGVQGSTLVTVTP